MKNSGGQGKAYSVLIDNEVFKEDLSAIEFTGRRHLIKSIRKKLSTHPYLYGKPLTGELKQYWKLKVGAYKIIYEIEKRQVTVHVIKEGFRKSAQTCLAAARRLGFL